MKDNNIPFAPGGPGGPPPAGPGTGIRGPMARLAPEYTFDILAPADIPRKYLHVDTEKMTAVLDTEHGSQTVKDFKYEDGKFSFIAMLGSKGDEVFHVVAKLYGGGIGLGEAAMEGDNTPKSPCVFTEVQ